MAHHNKAISKGKFKEAYLSRIDVAIEQAKQFEGKRQALIHSLGTNIPELFRILRRTENNHT